MNQSIRVKSNPATAWAAVFVVCAHMLVMRLLPFVLFRWALQVDAARSLLNLSPTLAVFLFCGVFEIDRRLSALVPLTIYFLSDLGVWVLTGRVEWAFYPSQHLVYLSLFILTTLGFLLRHRQNIPTIAGTGMVGCAVFFIITNYGVWSSGDMYEHTWTGLIDCYTAAIPFFGNTLLGTTFYVAVFCLLSRTMRFGSPSMDWIAYRLSTITKLSGLYAGRTHLKHSPVQTNEWCLHAPSLREWRMSNDG